MNGIERGVLTQTGLALSVSEIWNSSLIMVLIYPSKTLGNSFMMLSSVGGSRIDKVLVYLVIWLCSVSVSFVNAINLLFVITSLIKGKRQEENENISYV